jgi:hypothetical protein
MGLLEIVSRVLPQSSVMSVAKLSFSQWVRILAIDYATTIHYYPTIELWAGKKWATDMIPKVFKNVVRGFSLVLHDPKGSHYRIWRWRISGIVKANLSPKQEQN